MAVWDDWKWDFWIPGEEPIPQEAKTERKISLCTTCMNRLNNLMITLPKNIMDNQDYPNVEFVLLDYNSTDMLENWVRDYMMHHIENGVLVYAKTTEPPFYTMSHSRNVAFKVATGDIVNNVDADNFTGPGFANTLNRMAEIRPTKAAFSKGKRMMHGRIGFYKDEFIELGGYDEDLVSYGFDDHNLLYRAMATGCKLMWWGYWARIYSERIPTPRSEKIRNMENKNRRETEQMNKDITFDKLDRKQFVVNQDRHWGKATVVKNFKEEIVL